MVNMQMSREEAKEYTEPSVSDAPQYPYGLCLDLNDDALEKLGMKTLPAVGTEMSLMARVVVTRTSAYQTQGNESETCLGLQITDMELGPAQADPAKAAAKLYG